MSVSKNPPFVTEEPDFCIVCGAPMFLRYEIVSYDPKTGEPISEEVFYCSRSKGHGECRRSLKEDSGNPIMDSFKGFFANLFGGSK